ncbi:MAG: hypothetical protein SFV54_18560 [Bryobacteraceae bacterium]|nr:hypothetical protein [Bryobacteraceae bacterium]
MGSAWESLSAKLAGAAAAGGSVAAFAVGNAAHWRPSLAFYGLSVRR